MAARLGLSREEFHRPTKTSRSATRPHREAVRAKIVVLAHRGWDHRTIAEKLGIDTRTVDTWVDRFAHEGLEGLRDQPRPGHAPIYSIEDRAL
ncbi:transposase, partial [mine drainage metagenome]